MLTNCLAECAHLTITVSQIERDIGRKSSFFIPPTPLHSTPPLGGFPSEHRHPVWYGKTRMVWLPDCEKISKIPLFVLAQLTNVTDRQTDRHRVMATAALCIASHGKKLSGNFGNMGRSNPWGDLDQMWLVGRHAGRNHVCNIS